MLAFSVESFEAELGRSLAVCCLGTRERGATGSSSLRHGTPDIRCGGNLILRHQTQRNERYSRQQRSTRILGCIISSSKEPSQRSKEGEDGEDETGAEASFRIFPLADSSGRSVALPRISRGVGIPRPWPSTRHSLTLRWPLNSHSIGGSTPRKTRPLGGGPMKFSLLRGAGRCPPWPPLPPPPPPLSPRASPLGSHWPPGGRRAESGMAGPKGFRARHWMEPQLCNEYGRRNHPPHLRSSFLHVMSNKY